ncbi:MAG: TauD/TfdA family dioxygenase [Tumebacillaceae bacterium]
MKTYPTMNEKQSFNPSDLILELTDGEREEIREIVDTLEPIDVANVTDDLLNQIEIAAKNMPTRLVSALIQFRRNPNAYGTLLIRNLPTDPQLPETPHDGRRSQLKESKVSEYTLLLNMLYLGEPIAYLDEKEGLLIQDIYPVAGQEYKQENTGSEFLEFHTEDGFHPYKPDYLGLVCLRQDHDRIAKTATACIRNVLHEVPSTAITILRENKFHLRLSTSFTKDDSTIRYSEPMPVLSGSLLEPDMCVDYFLMEGITPEAQWALDILKEALLRKTISFPLAPGDLILIDNRLAAHARTAFKPRYDGQDRWLQRMFVVQDFRRSAFSRSSGRHICTPLSVEFTLKDTQGCKE